MEKILFIKTPIPMLQDDKLEPDMGLLYCATYVKRHCDVNVSCVDLSVDSKKKLFEEAKDSRIFCFSTFTANYNLTVEIVRELREKVKKGSIFIAGGHHASALPEQVANDFDYVIQGEGEIAESNLINKLIRGEKPKEKIIVGKCVENLNEIGWIDYSLVNMDNYTRKVNGRKSISILTSRGCPYKCEFCNSTLMKAYRTVRFRTAEDVVDEIKMLNFKYGITSFRIQDDIFSINRNRLRKMADLLEGYNFSFRCFARVDNIDEKILEDFKRMGVVHLSFGVESGSQKILDNMNKGICIEDICKSIFLAKKYQMKCRVYLIVGYPGETIETLDETIKLIKEIQPDDLSIYPLLPYPGTPLYSNPKKYKITYIDPDFSKYYQIYGNKECGYVFETESMTLEKLKFYRDYLVKGLEKVCPWAIEDEENR
ncbi:MAG: B12-binding domain-containing radical SAM protein [Lachnospiraceae bacterium]|nr:B12-binding domain-containing radical SAM protein [Lachnospiraceae bacterium]